LNNDKVYVSLFQKLEIPLTEVDIRKMLVKLNDGLEGNSVDVR